jgi:hypothetical protein
MSPMRKCEPAHENGNREECESMAENAGTMDTAFIEGPIAQSLKPMAARRIKHSPRFRDWRRT